jgi:rhamnogalacturonan acetylesterase
MNSATLNPRRRRLLATLASCFLICSFSRAQEAASQMPVPLNSKLPTIFIVGDSTANTHGNDQLGWGDPFSAYFDTSKVNVANRARAGRSSRTYFAEGLWDKTLRDIKRGDLVLIQFGHNDGGPVDREKARGSLPGLGDETQAVTKPDGSTETVHTFGWYIRKFIDDTKARGGTAIVLSPTIRNIWTDGKVERSMGQFSEWSREIAASENVAFVDVSTIAADRFQAMGPEKMAAFFPHDHTHTNAAGAAFNAEVVLSGLKRVPGGPLLEDLSPTGREVQISSTTDRAP